MGRRTHILFAGTILPLLIWGLPSNAETGRLSVSVTDNEGRMTPCFIALEEMAAGQAYPLPQHIFRR